MHISLNGFPATLDIDYPDRQLNRLTTAFRLLAVIPIGIILALVSGPQSHGGGEASHTVILAGGGIVFLPAALMILFVRRYPRWWFDWNVELTRFSIRVAAYVALLRDEYPSADEEQAVHVALPYPDAAAGLNRWLPLVKWVLALPHYIVLVFVGLAAICCVILAWFAILFTGRYPRSLFDFVVGVFRWAFRVAAYAFLLATDRYPPFSVTP
ncbi:MAG TPA: DUF4389 domain-containing protein [bacterium]|nr:DUF4389 domain-containing protein [bacterium]